MRLLDGNILYSATDLVNFLGCSHSTASDIQHVGEYGQKVDDDPYMKLLQDKGMEHERRHLAWLRASGLLVQEVVTSASLDERVNQTRTAMKDGADVIYQGTLFRPPWHGFSDFLLRRDGVPSIFGDYAYEVVDTKLARSAKPKHVIQLAVYSQLIADAQHAQPHQMHIVLGDESKVSLHVADFVHYCELAGRRFEAFVSQSVWETAAEPCGHCAFCRWGERCSDEWDQGDHLSLVAAISGSQRTKLRAAGITTLRQLAMLDAAQTIPTLHSESLQRIRAQAALQLQRRDGGDPTLELLPTVPEKGFARLPRPNEGDLFFDMEGDPLHDGGLEYLFGFNHVSGEKETFTAFWAHDRTEEKRAFQQAVDFICKHRTSHPGAHVYHYASYEESALKRLSSYHGTREAEVDDLLRNRVLVDLYKVVREAIRVSEPAYSLKNLEVFFATARADSVKNAGDSIVVYEKWRALGDDQLLQDISDYNAFDCASTRKCRDWLLTLRPETVDWFSLPAFGSEDADASATEARNQAEAQTTAMQVALVEVDDAQKSWRELVGHLLEFHRREAKPSWWNMFSRMDMSDEELVNDAECIGGLTADPSRTPQPLKRSMIYSFRFPPQDFKMRAGDLPLRAGGGEAAGEVIELNEDAGTLSLKLGPTRSPLPERFSLIPPGPISDKVLREAVYRYAGSIVKDENRYGAITSILRRLNPRLHNRADGAPIVADDAAMPEAAVDAIRSMQDTHMLVQGPPGSGKTFTSAHAIVELLRTGKRVGVASNSHKAINNLLAAVERLATESGLVFRGVKKSSADDQKFDGRGCIADTSDNAAAADPANQLVAGTAWLFARPMLDQSFDYLFIDEAGQVSLANVIAMGVSARNIVLVGDQMQLSQPTQGVHPGGSGVSALEHLLGELATVPQAAGIFLATTWRLHPDICGFISQAVYDGRLEPAHGNRNQVLTLASEYDALALAPSGLRFVEVQHSGCGQNSEQEAERIAATYESLLKQWWTDRHGVKRQVGRDDILVVTPYNMQVNLLKARLPFGARVGTVDKFQGQEAAVVLISMVTSSGADLPRNIEFLYSRNRLNVAISRAKCLAVVFANPRLLEVTCKTVAQLRLVNTLCWVKSYADQQATLAGSYSDQSNSMPT